MLDAACGEHFIRNGRCFDRRTVISAQSPMLLGAAQKYFHRPRNGPRPEYRHLRLERELPNSRRRIRCSPSSIARSNIVLVDSSCRGLDAIHPEYEPRRVRVRHAVAANVFCKAGHVAQRNLQWLRAREFSRQARQEFGRLGTPLTSTHKIK